MNFIVQGTVGGWDVQLLDAPQGGRGIVRARVRFGGDQPWRELDVSWNIDSHGIRVGFGETFAAFDVRGVRDDEGTLKYSLVGRGVASEFQDLRFVRAGEEAGFVAKTGSKKALKIKAQMPGKIVKVLVGSGSAVSKNQPILVMEAMKMENEIRAPQAGQISQLLVSVGQVIESGAVLVVME